VSILFDAYETVVGFECHVQLSTQSKLFSAGRNSFGAQANSLVDVVDAGLPGVLPSLNRAAVEYAIKLGLALSCDIRRKSVFARKHYFYPDLPKGYQISQFDKPICENGKLFFMLNGEERSIRIRRIHIEEDAGKNTHVEDSNKSYVDFNRAGTPLLEIVSEPDLRSPEEAMEAIRAVRQIVTFLNICDGNMQEGSLRADINVSVRKKGVDELGTRTETKNLNSFRFLGQAISFEARRQIIELESNNEIKQETRLWDPNLKESRSMRSKEESHDYRYFPDPDLLPLVLSEELIESIKSTLPELPLARFKRYQENFALSAYDAEILVSDKKIADYFDAALKKHSNAKSIANWIINDILRSSRAHSSNKEDGVGDFSTAIAPESIAELVSLIDSKIISNSIAKNVFLTLEKHPQKSPINIIKENNLELVDNSEEICLNIERILDEHKEETEKYLSGKTKVFGFLMGQLMRLMKGKADPSKAHDFMLAALLKRKKN
jgi:aspartyl-tRNA(Asn)/glutamyl-tRNA(Gln) amidotransferase subunit B